MVSVHRRSYRSHIIVLGAAIILVALMGVLCAGALADPSAASLANRPDERQIKTDLADILSDSRYREDTGRTLLWMRLVEAVLDPVIDFLDSMFGNQVQTLLEHSPILYWTVVAVLIVLALAIFAHIFAVLVNTFGEPDDSRAPTATVETSGVAPENALRAARDAARRGEYSRAIVLTYLATLHELDRQDRLRFSDSKTNRRMVRQIEDPDLRSRLLRITGTVDAIIYGNRPGSRETYEQIARVAAGVGVS